MVSPARDRISLSILVPTRNEGANLRQCLEGVAGWASEIVIVDSGSTDGTVELALEYGATVVPFRYEGGWPKKRNWALENHPWSHEWVLLLDADEILNEQNRQEIAAAIQGSAADGYWVCFQIFFLGRQLRYGDTALWKLSLFRHRLGRYEARLLDQDHTMGDVEVHEHVVVKGDVRRLSVPIRHENVNSLSRYIEKHNEYSNWEAKVFLEGQGELKASLFGNQAERRRWLKKQFLFVPGFPVLVFVYTWIVRGAFLDGVPGLIYSGFRAMQFFHIKAKIYERGLQRSGK